MLVETKIDCTNGRSTVCDKILWRSSARYSAVIPAQAGIQKNGVNSTPFLEQWPPAREWRNISRGSILSQKHRGL